jgi:hypothetical protein
MCPYERFVFATEDDAKEHFIQSILDNCYYAKNLQIFTEQTLRERINSYSITQFNIQFEELATITRFKVF